MSASNLALRIKRDQQIVTSYTYGYTGDSRPVDWKVIAAEDEAIEGEHIRCIQLKDGEDLDKLMEHFISIDAKAVVFVNTRDDFTVKAQHWPKQSAIPVLLLKSSDGKELLSTVENSEVLGKVEVESHVDAIPTTAVTEEPVAVLPTKPLADNEKDTEPDSRPGAKEKLKGWLNQIGDRRDFKAEVKQLMFINDNPIVVSEDIGVFTMVMSTFQQYEKTVSTCKKH